MTARWKDGSKGMLTVNALFAGFSGALAINLAIRKWDDYSTEMFALLLAVAALYFFALAAEWITDALDEGDVDRYLRSMIVYNVGVVLVLLSIALLLWSQSHRVLAVIAALLSIRPWLTHAAWFMTASGAEKDAYRAKLLTEE